MSSSEAMIARIAELFAQELGVDDVGDDTHFIFAGGDSLAAEAIAAAIASEFGIELKTAVLLDFPTPREMGEVVAEKLAKKPR